MYLLKGSASSTYNIIEWIDSPTGDGRYIGHQGVEECPGIVLGQNESGGSYRFVMSDFKYKIVAKLRLRNIKN